MFIDFMECYAIAMLAALVVLAPLELISAEDRPHDWHMVVVLAALWPMLLYSVGVTLLAPKPEEQ